MEYTVDEGSWCLRASLTLLQGMAAVQVLGGADSATEEHRAAALANSSTCVGQWVDRKPLGALSPSALLWANLALYGGFLILAFALAPCWRHGARTRAVLHSLLLLTYAVDRAGWAAFLVAVRVDSRSLPSNFNFTEQRVSLLADDFGTLCFFALVGLLLTEGGDSLVVGWKTSRRLWTTVKLLILLLFLSGAAVVVLTALKTEGPSRLLTFSDDGSSSCSLIAVLALACLASRYHRRTGPMALLARFRHARRAINAWIVLTLLCFLVRALPPRWLALGLSALGMCPRGPDDYLSSWAFMLQTHWLPELVPASGMLLLLHALHRLKLEPLVETSSTRGLRSHWRSERSEGLLEGAPADHWLRSALDDSALEDAPCALRASWRRSTATTRTRDSTVSGSMSAPGSGPAMAAAGGRSARPSASQLISPSPSCVSCLWTDGPLPTGRASPPSCPTVSSASSMSFSSRLLRASFGGFTEPRHAEGAAPAPGLARSASPTPSVPTSPSERPVSAAVAPARAGRHVEVVYPAVREEELWLLETISECPYAYCVPLAWISLAQADDRQAMSRLTQRLKAALSDAKRGAAHRGHAASSTSASTAAGGNVPRTPTLTSLLSTTHRKPHLCDHPSPPHLCRPPTLILTSLTTLTHPRPHPHLPHPEGCSPQPAARSPQPAARSPQPTPRISRPTSHIPHPTPHTPHPTPHVPHPTPHTPHLTYHVPRTTPHISRPTSHVSHPTPRTPHPTSRTPRPTSHIPHPTPHHISRPTSHIPHLTSHVPHPTSLCTRRPPRPRPRSGGGWRRCSRAKPA